MSQSISSEDSHSVQDVSANHQSIHGRQAVTSLLTATELSTSPFLPLLLSLINTAFSHAIANGPKDLLPSTYRRLHSTSDIIRELGPDALVYIISTSPNDPDELVVYATASVKCFTSKVTDSTSEFIRNFKHIDVADLVANVERWELTLMAVDPSIQRQGLAGKLMGLAEKEIRRRTKVAGHEVQIVLTTAKAHNEHFYTKRGYITTGEKEVEKGTFESITGFTVLEMMKNI